MKELYTQIEEYISYHGWDLAGQRSLIGVSGGRDSMSLLGFFLDQKYPCEVAHVNFGLRGAESDGETELVQEYCSQKDVSCHVLRADTRDYVRTHGVSTQTAARDIRYDFFGKISKEHKLKYIATAHHADDNIETLLMRLMDGAGLRGLGGIPPQNGSIIRPLLSLSAEAMQRLAEQLSVPYLEDSSNRSDDYHRNQIRHDLLPVLKSLAGNKYQNISESIKHLDESAQLYSASLSRRLRKIEQKRGRLHRYSIATLSAQPQLDTILYEAFERYGLRASQVPELKKLLHAETGKYIQTDTHVILHDRQDILVGPIREEQPVIILPETGEVKVHELHTLSIRQEKVGKLKKEETAYRLRDVQLPLIIRPWMQGDYFYPEGLGKKKKISDFFSDQKMSLFDKKEAMILADAQGHILSVLGLRADGRYLAIEGESATIIRLQTTSS